MKPLTEKVEYAKVSLRKSSRPALRNTAPILILIAIVPFFFTGCFGLKEINDMAIISGATLDIGEDGQDYYVTAEIVNKSSETVAGDVIQETLASSGRTIADAIENCNFVDSRTAYWSHAKTFIVSKDLAAETGISPLLDYVMRNYKARISTDLLISNTEKAADILELSTPSTNVKLLDLQEMLLTDKTYGGASSMKVYQAVDTLKSEGIQLTIPVVTANNDMAIIEGTAVFKEDKLIDFLNQDETQWLMFLQNRIDKTHITADETTFRVMKSKTKVKPGVQNGAIKVEIEIEINAALSQLSADTIDYDYEKLETLLERTVETSVSDLVKKAQYELKSDIFGFGKKLHDKEPDYWEKISNSWDDYYFGRADVVIHCSAKLQLGETY